MATSRETFSSWAWNGSAGNYRLRKLDERTAVNVAKNQSTVRTRIWLQSTSPAYFYGINCWHEMWAAGTRRKAWNDTRSITAGGEVLVIDVEYVYTHKADGTLTLSTGGVFSNSYTGVHTIDTSITLDTIPRATTPTLASGASFVTGGATTLQLLRASTSFTHDVTYRIGSKSGTIATGAGVSASWTPPHNLAEEFKNSASGTVAITVVTKSGSTTVGSKTANFTVTAAGSIVPTVSQVLWDDANPTVKSAVGAFVQGESLIKGTVTAQGVHGSTITERRLVAGGQTFTESQAWQPTSSGLITAKGTAKDSRSRSGERTANFTVLPYTPPSLSTLTRVRRATNTSGAVGDGAYLRLDITAAVQSLKPSTAEKNALKLRVRTRPKDGAWTTRNNVTHTALSYASQMIMVSGGAAFNTATSYDVEVTITDNLGKSATVLYSIGTIGAALDLVGNAAGIGKVWERGALDVGPGGIYDNGNRVGGYTLGSGPASDLPSAYPEGQSSLMGDASWPNTWGSVLTVKTINNRAVQLNFHQHDSDISVRRATIGADSWGDWVQMAESVAGQVTQFAGDTAPRGWLLCQGQAVSRTTYAALYAVIGNKYGAGDGTSTFNVPDLRGRVAAGLSTDTEFNTLGKKSGAKTHTLTTAQMPSHNHAPGSGQSNFWGLRSGTGGQGLWDPTNTANVATNTTTGNRGSGQAHNNIQPTITLNYIIKT